MEPAREDDSPWMREYQTRGQDEEARAPNVRRGGVFVQRVLSRSGLGIAGSVACRAEPLPRVPPVEGDLSRFMSYADVRGTAQLLMKLALGGESFPRGRDQGTEA